MAMALEGRLGTAPGTDPQAVIAYAKDQGIKFIDFRFSDLLGQWQHFSVPLSELTERVFAEGVGFDGSSIKGFQQIHESDMLLVPDPKTACVDPILEVPTLSLICDIVDPVTKARYSRDPRYIAHKAEAYLRQSGIADTSYWGPEMEFYIFNSIRFDQTVNEGYYHIDSVEGIWNSGRNGVPNLGFRPRLKEGYFPVPPVDKLQDLRSRISLALAEAGIEVEVHHHEVGTAGQTEIDMRFGTLTEMADRVLKYKYAVKSAAAEAGKTATFMPKPLFGDNGSGMHVHQSLWKGGQPLFYEQGGYAELSGVAMQYAAGLLKHGPALAAITNPSVNSYRRLVPGYEAPVNLIISARNRSAVIRVPMYFRGPEFAKAKRIEYRAPDPMANPYLAFAALLMAGLDGIERDLEPPNPVDRNLYSLSPREARRIKTLPASLDQALDALEADHDFLLKGGVFTADLLESFIALKRQEADAVRLRPTPLEYAMYYDA